MAYRCPHYLCEASSSEGLIQQVALSYLRHGYWWYVTGTIPDRKEPCEVDRNILAKYEIRKDWRFIAHNKQRGYANLQYIRHGRFYILMATKGWHEFKEREAKRIRDARKYPILIPRVSCGKSADNQRRAMKANRVFDGYTVSFRRGGYLKKNADEKTAYRNAMEQWKRQARKGVRLPRPPKGTPDPKWHSCVEIESQTLQRLRAYFTDIATHRGQDNLSYEFAHTGYVPYQPVKRQLVRIIKDVNKVRSVAGCSEQIPYRVVLSLKRQQLSPFAGEGTVNLDSAA
jgi:hypothetical protein